MTVKLVLLKSGEDIIADVTEMVVGEDHDRRVVGYFFDKPCVVKLRDTQDRQHKSNPGFKVSMFPWMPLAEESKIPVTAEWVVTMVEPKEKLTKMYLEDVIGNGQDSENSDASESSTSD